MSRSSYIKQLENVAESSKKAINDLTREVYELREQLKITINRQKTNARSSQKSSNLS